MNINDLTSEFQEITSEMHRRAIVEGFTMTGMVVIITTTDKTRIFVEPGSALSEITAACCETADVLCSAVEVPQTERDARDSSYDSTYNVPSDFAQSVT